MSSPSSPLPEQTALVSFFSFIDLLFSSSSSSVFFYFMGLLPHRSLSLRVLFLCKNLRLHGSSSSSSWVLFFLDLFLGFFSFFFFFFFFLFHRLLRGSSCSSWVFHFFAGLLLHGFSSSPRAFFFLVHHILHGPSIYQPSSSWRCPLCLPQRYYRRWLHSGSQRRRRKRSYQSCSWNSFSWRRTLRGMKQWARW